MENTFENERKLIESVCSTFDFRYEEDEDGVIEISFFTKAGQDFRFTLDPDPFGYLKDLDSFIEGFDPDYEAVLWTDGEGHGVNGAPYRLKDIITDMEEAIFMVTKFRKVLKG